MGTCIAHIVLPDHLVEVVRSNRYYRQYDEGRYESSKVHIHSAFGAGLYLSMKPIILVTEFLSIMI